MEGIRLTIGIKLKEDHDFSWLTNYDDVFEVFDQQDSGNISFGVKLGNQKRFVKYAGARNLVYQGSVTEAIKNLENAKEVYQDLAHPSLIKLDHSFKTKQGLGLEFEWVEGVNLYPHWTFDVYDRHQDPRSLYYQTRHLPYERKLSMIETMLGFLLHTEENGYTPVDFYDGSLMYDMDTGVTKIIDIDFFRKGSIKNTLGQDYWGPKRIKAPEENTKGAVIDSRTTVFTAGKIIMELLSTHESPTLKELTLNPTVEKTIQTAIKQEKENRFLTVHGFYQSWSKKVKNECNERQQ